MTDKFVYLIPLPPGINEMVTPCPEGHTIYIDSSLDDAHQLRAYQHALNHIEHNDFAKENVQEIESDAHERSEL